MSSILRQTSSRINGAKSRGPVTEEGKRASAANSALSTGPVTPEGKARSSLNGLDHGLLARSIVLPHEESDDIFQNHLNALIEELRPATYKEHYCIQTMAVCDYRRLRAWCLEMAAFAIASHLHRDSADASMLKLCEQIPGANVSMAVGNLSDSSNRLELFRRYDMGLARESRRALEEFHKLRENRRLESRRAARRENKISDRSEPNIREIPS